MLYFHSTLKIKMPFPQTSLWLVVHNMSLFTSVRGFLIFLLRNFLIWQSELKQCTQNDNGESCLLIPMVFVPNPLFLLRLLAFLVGRRVPCPASTQDPDQGIFKPSSPPYLSQSLEMSSKKQRPTNTFQNLNETVEFPF